MPNGIDNNANTLSDIKRIFIGSTNRDLFDYRSELAQALNTQYSVFLSERNAYEYSDTVEMCKQKLNDSDAYFGIFAFWYGSIPPKQKVSITHMEFRWAKEKLEQAKRPKMAIFLPGRNYDAPEPCAAVQELSSRAEELLKQIPKPKKKNRQQHEKNLQEFMREVNPDSQWQLVNLFEDKHQLCLRALNICLIWAKELFKTAAKAGENSYLRIPSHLLGRMGREKHLKAVKDIIATSIGPEIPALAILAHGKEDAGLRNFLDALMQEDILKRSAPPKRGRPPTARYGLESLCRWVIKQAGSQHVLRQTDDIVDALSKALQPVLIARQVVIILQDVDRFDSGGLTGFYRSFWLPLYEKLSIRKNKNPAQHRLILIVESSSQQRPTDEIVSTWDPDEGVDDYSTLISLPEFTDIKRLHVLQLLEELDVAMGDRENIVDAVLTTSEGEVDGNPLRVYDRLRDELSSLGD